MIGAEFRRCESISPTHLVLSKPIQLQQLCSGRVIQASNVLRCAMAYADSDETEIGRICTTYDLCPPPHWSSDLVRDVSRHLRALAAIGEGVIIANEASIADAVRRRHEPR